MQDSFQFAIDPVAALDELIAGLLWRAHRGRTGELLLGKDRELLDLLRYHKGRDNAKPLEEIATKLRTGERTIKLCARALTMDFGVPIGASRQAPWGYFLCVTPEDYAAARRPYVHEILALAERVKALQASPRLLEIFGQLQIELKEGEQSNV